MNQCASVMAHGVQLGSGDVNIIDGGTGCCATGNRMIEPLDLHLSVFSDRKVRVESRAIAQSHSENMVCDLVMQEHFHLWKTTSSPVVLIQVMFKEHIILASRDPAIMCKAENYECE